MAISRAVRRRLAPRPANISGGPWTWRTSPTARCWCPTISSARSIASGTTASKLRCPGWPPTGPSHSIVVRAARRSRMMSAFSRTAMLFVKLLAPAGLLLAGGSPSHAGDVKAGAAKAMMCQACHGLDGLVQDAGLHRTSPARSSPISSRSCRRSNPARERTMRCRWSRHPCLTRTLRISQPIFRRSRSASANCRDGRPRFDSRCLW